MAITVKEQSREFTKIETYLLTQSKDNILLKDIEDGTPIEVESYMIYEVDKNDEQKTILALLDTDKKVYATMSQTFIEEFIGIFELFETTPVPVIKKSGTTKNGRTYLTCVLDMSKAE